MPESHCFHCGLPIVENTPPSLKVLNKQQYFCCHGCKAVCEAIVDSGHADFYQYRENKNKTANTQDLPALLSQLKLYDKDEIQRDFVRTGHDKKNQQNWKEAWLILEEIRCAACLWLNERTLRQLDGVLDVDMDYTGQQAKVRWNPDKIQLSEILSAISHIGYIAHPFDPQHREALNKEQQQRSLKRIIFAVILGMMVMQTAIGSYFFGDQLATGEYPLWIKISRWTSLVVTGFILAYPGQLFFRNAWRDLKNKTLGMDVPVALGLSVAWLGSMVSTISGQGEVYFESIAMFVLLMLIARYMELRARISATALLDRHAKIIPLTARKFIGNETHEVSVFELAEGDKLQVLPGETVPVDAILCSHQSSFDESLLSGEALPVTHLQGETVLGGSVNIEQPIKIGVLSSNAASTLGKIQQLTKQSVSSRPYYVDLAERVAGRFVLVILLIALSTLLYWLWADPAKALGNMIAVLIVTCPCALALASPVALSLCAAGLSKLHVLALRLSAIEQISHVDTVVFDKTGTLTTGKPQLESIIVVGEKSENDYLQIAASIEKGSEHPFSRAILKAAADLELLNLEQHTNHPGQGIEALIDGETWKLGSYRFAGGDLVGVDQQKSKQSLPEKINKLRQDGLSVLYLSNAHGIQALFCLADCLRYGVGEFLTALSTTQEFVILSGDHQQSVQSVAQQLGISDALGGLSPDDKLKWIKDRQQSGHHVLMLGDGINDAPTLAAADVSLSFGDATDLAQSHSDFVSLKTDFSELANAIGLMKKTRRIIVQNLAWAVLYNVIAVPAAAMGWITPWMAAIGMSFSSFVVVLNSLRLKI